MVIWILNGVCTKYVRAHKKGENFRMDFIVCYDLLFLSQIRLETVINNTFNRMNQYVDASEQRQGSCCIQKPTQVLWRRIVLSGYQKFGNPHTVAECKGNYENSDYHLYDC